MTFNAFQEGLAFNSVGEIFKCDHSKKKLLTSAPLVMLIILHKVGLTFGCEDV